MLGDAAGPLIEGVKLLLALSITAVMSVLIYDFIDRPIQAYFRRFLHRGG